MRDLISHIDEATGKVMKIELFITVVMRISNSTQLKL
jgi:hypothetical protein